MSFRANWHNDTFLRQAHPPQNKHPIVEGMATFLQHTHKRAWMPAPMTAEYMSNFFIVVLRKPRTETC